MLSLLDKWWTYKQKRYNKQVQQWLEKERKERIRAKYGKYLDMAEKATSKPLYRVNQGLEKLWEECISSGVVKTKRDSLHYHTAEFNNGFTVKFWTANRMFAYASRSEWVSPLGTKLSFDEEMPGMHLCYFIEEQVEKKQINP